MNKAKRPSWIFIVNQNEGRLLHAREVPENRHQLRVRETVRNDWEEHQRGRPQPLAAKNGHTHSSFGHEGETLRRRFAQDVASWLQRKVRKHGIDRVAVLAPPRFLAELKSLWPNNLQCHVDQYECGLSYLDEGELVQHPLIEKILGNGTRKV